MAEQAPRSDGKPLDLPAALLARVAGAAAAQDRACARAMRLTCMALRDAVQASNTTLVLGAQCLEPEEAPPGLRERLAALLGDCPCVTTLCMRPTLKWMSVDEAMQAGGLPLRRRLRSLVLMRRDDLQTLESLAGCTALQALNLNYCASLRDISGLPSLGSLRELSLHGCSQLEDLGPLSGCSALERLDAAGFVYKLASLQPLSSCAALQRLDLRVHLITDLSPLASLVLLRYLSLADVGCDPGPLASLTALQQLKLTYCQLGPDLHPIPTLLTLKRLSLEGCSVTSLSPLTTLTALQQLTLRCDQALHDVFPLTCLSALRSLCLSRHSNVPAIDVSPLTVLTALRVQQD